MKATIHPQTHEVTITCSSCSTTFTTHSTKQSIHVEVCNKCHPFYTGEQRFLDAKGTVEKFSQRMKQAQAYKAQRADKKDKKEKKTGNDPKSLKELLGEM